MLAITIVNSLRSQAKRRSAAGYAHPLGKAAVKERGLEACAREYGPALTCPRNGPPLVSLGAAAKAEHVERLARGLHPTTGMPPAKALGGSRVTGLGLAFSALKDVSAVFAGADAATRDAILDAMQRAARAALGFAEQAAATRPGKGRIAKQVAEAGVARAFNGVFNGGSA